jgi:hypothetical protein
LEEFNDPYVYKEEDTTNPEASIEPAPTNPETS